MITDAAVDEKVTTIFCTPVARDPRCRDCGREGVDCGRTVFSQDLGKLAAPRASTRRCARYVVRRLLIDRTTISAIAAELGVSWHTVSTIAMRTTADLVAAAGADRLAGYG